MNESENVEKLIEEFRSEINSFESPVRVLDPLDFSSGDEIKTPSGYYISTVICDNCGCEVFLWVRKSIPVPHELPAERCPTCRVTGHIYRPISDKEMRDEFKRRFED